MAEHSKSGFTYKESKDGIKIATRHAQNWSPFLLAILSFLAFVAVVILLLFRIMRLVTQTIPPESVLSNILLILGFGLAIYILAEVCRQALDNAFLNEDITINKSSITIDKSGFLLFRKNRVIPAERIRCIQPTILLSSPDSKLADVMMNTTKISKISICVKQKKDTYFPICRGISLDDTVNTLDRIHEKYPQYY
jgi:hypothetical protein